MPSDTPLPSSFDGDTEFYEENRWQKFSRRLREEPLIPLGCLLTCAALYQASRSIKSGDHNKTNRMFRYRIYGQGFTIVAMVVGAKYWEGDRKKRKEFEAVIAEKKAKEKQEAWIRELEARDEEEKEIRALREKRRNMISGGAGSPAATSTTNDEKAKNILDGGDAGKEDGTSGEEKPKKSSILEAVAALGGKK